ncbi:hypothetical protein A3H65_03800 [Candidatus Giovannonibacteria bacterium RIFCSPLOWO2_02_FULL_45_14]|uniref:Uncharacterized protein n=1 Tax=Candidatus Giovannonibacteria bacterium RIFCSPLOWO2_12_FULL_44_15 TaxID=1798364 RepID=A0A1F5XZX4_9BACT|nr:MAG: hypothetical protein A3C75_00195 [Candidatus Giovannonibacteria bacterium RIFCSPHIGHO2_02_FULL_44_31]OGF76301.1 MAG: hypothetical protein A3E62_03545 [Candidatus Giovannonibacteria bacterium RIFCSPHIGHO2_12_FULL_44_29]OGF91064.1 MAG: hypothetical protein A3H65_03800 [Candidatus Giovannonibacteria bacterium RIFCSPLOWO2_02_FULL_45_14]OGF93497.1 MAG: hypothetical protein A3G54_01925 [Candidatus Giovannonibacteria bacterium RIFCSPLOWO2_12_FULL_44_15]
MRKSTLLIILSIFVFAINLGLTFYVSENWYTGELTNDQIQILNIVLFFQLFVSLIFVLILTYLSFRNRNDKETIGPLEIWRLYRLIPYPLIISLAISSPPGIFIGLVLIFILLGTSLILGRLIKPKDAIYFT